MGHSRIGTLPASQKWQDVVSLIGNGADVDQVADSTLTAAQRAFASVSDDAGFREAARLLLEMVQAAKTQGADGLAALGMELSDNPSVAELAMVVNEAFDRRLDALRQRSDFGELAGKALVASVISWVERRLPTLLEPTREDMVGALKQAGTEKGFGKFGREFFGRLTNESLSYFLSKTLGTKVGEGQRFTTNNQIAEFMVAMGTHCHETSEIVEQYCGEWLSKHRYTEKGKIARESVENFAWFAMKKIGKELSARARKHGN